jgi:hypothetical protein
MKSIALLILLSVTSCGKYDVRGRGGTGLGQVRSINTVTTASASTVAALQLICNALAVKEAALSSAVGSLLTYSASQTDCEGNPVFVEGSQQVVIQRSAQDYILVKKDGLPFIFPDVETRTSGVFKDLCNLGASLLNPIINGTEATFISIEGISGSDCSPVFGEETCLALEKGQVSGTDAVITSRDIMRVRTGGTKGRIGFFTQRTKVSQSICSTNGAIISKALLK